MSAMISTGKDLSKRIFYLFNHQLLSYICLLYIFLWLTSIFIMVNKGMIATFVGVCGAALLYRLYNQSEFEKYSAKKLKDEQKAKQKMEYQKFLAERRQKR